MTLKAPGCSKCQYLQVSLQLRHTAPPLASLEQVIQEISVLETLHLCNSVGERQNKRHPGSPRRTHELRVSSSAY